MRKDMARVIVERPRRGSRSATTKDPKGWKKRRLGRDCELDDLPTKESMSPRRKYGWDCKELNENLNPLKRFLERSVGRPWDKVFSEISEHIDMNSTVKRHIWQHVFDFVEQHTFMEDGKVWTHGRWNKERAPIEDGFVELYIHPVDRLLKKVKRPKGWVPRWKRRHEKPVERVEGPNNTQFHKVNGIWYIVHLRPIPQKLSKILVLHDANKGAYNWEVANKAGEMVDVLLKYSLYWISKSHGRHELRNKYGKEGVYGFSCKQMSGKELKNANLKNDPQPEDKPYFSKRERQRRFGE